MGSAEESLLRTAFHFPWCEKRARRLDDAAEDRLSDLPDCLLHDILSRLPSWQAVQTSTLSRRWKHLWRSVSCLDIDQRQFPGSEVRGSRQHGCFEDFADGILASSVPEPLHAFRLHVVDRWSASFERWVRRGLKRRPAIVDIICNVADDNMFTVEWPPRQQDGLGTGCRLTRLVLCGLKLRYGFMEELGALCPVLEELHIDRCRYDSCTIASPMLKTLVVFCRTSYSTLVIQAPRLASLALYVPFDGTGDNPVITAPGHKALASLAQASIHIHDQGKPIQRTNNIKLEFLRSMCGFLARLSNVWNLLLSGFTTTALLDQESLKFPVFQNLKQLILRCCDVGALNSLQVLLRVLDSTPSLEKLGLQHCKFSGRLGGRKRKTEMKRTSSKQRVKTLDEHKNLSLIEIKCQPNDQAQWDKILGKCSKKTQPWQIVRK